MLDPSLAEFKVAAALLPCDWAIVRTWGRTLLDPYKDFAWIGIPATLKN
jgi:hypothetical protein